jgi:anti-anti-sigma regulatory factor
VSETSAKMMVLVGKKFACVKISGRANFNSSIDFKTLLNDLQQEGYRYFVLELSECQLMDSTFLGVLAGFGLKLSVACDQHCTSGIELLNASPRIIDLLESLGVLHLFKVVDGPLAVPGQTETRDLAPGSHTKVDITRACLEAHQTLMDINAANVPKFKDVAQYLAEKLKSAKAS